MLYLYDEALVDKIKSWTSKTDMHIYGPEEATRTFEVIGDVTNDAPIKLPLIVLSHRGGYTIGNPNRTPLTYGGFKFENNLKTGKVSQLNAIPISIPYQLDVYTKYYKDTDAYVRNFIFNIINYPSFEIVVPFHGKDIKHKAKLRLADTVADNSDIPEHLIKGQFTRMSLQIDVDDAYLWDIRVKDPVYIDDIGLEIKKYPVDSNQDYIKETIDRLEGENNLNEENSDNRE